MLSKGQTAYPTDASTKEQTGLNDCMGRTVSGNPINMKGLDLGCVVKVKGGIGEFRDMRQITLERISMSNSGLLAV